MQSKSRLRSMSCTLRLLEVTLHGPVAAQRCFTSSGKSKNLIDSSLAVRSCSIDTPVPSNSEDAVALQRLPDVLHDTITPQIDARDLASSPQIEIQEVSTATAQAGLRNASSSPRSGLKQTRFGLESAWMAWLNLTLLLYFVHLRSLASLLLLPNLSVRPTQR